MAPTLSHAPSRVVDNFYGNSFKQLSMVQQRQVGLMVGAAVADAAARPLNGYTPEEVEMHLQRVQGELQSSSDKAVEGALVFAHVPVRGKETGAVEGSDATARSASAAHSLQHHSFSYLLYFEVLRAMSAARGEFDVQDVEQQLVRATSAVHARRVFEQEHASLLHALCCVLPTPAIYPYASDAALRAFLEPLLAFLTEPTMKAGESEELSSHSHVEAAAAERAAVCDYTVSALGVVLRNLQSNPDSTRNAAFMAVPNTTAIFPQDVQAFVPTLASGDAADELSRRRRHLWDIQQRLAARSSTAGSRWLPVRATAADAVIVRESLAIARAPVSFAKGVAQAIRLGGPTCQRAMLVGGLLGSKLGVRHVPLEWLSATPDHKPVVTMASEVAQYVWNPPPR